MKKLIALLMLMVLQAGASVVTSIPGGTVVPMPAVNYFGPGPQTFGPGITWSSTNAFDGGGSVFGFTPGLPCPYNCYSFSANGNWTGGLAPMAGLNDSTDYYGNTDTMTFAFASPVGAVGGFLNYLPGSSNPDHRRGMGFDGTNLIEPAFALTFATGGGNDSGAFYGFRESTANISYFTLTDNFVGITNLTTGPPNAVPEPSSLLLIGTGLLGVIGYTRRHLGL